VVGDVDRDAALELVRRTLGALPARRVNLGDPLREDLRCLPSWTGPLTSILQAPRDVSVGRAQLLHGWRAAPWSDAEERGRLQAVSRLLSRRLHRELREVRTLTYSVGATCSPSRAYPEASLLSASLVTEPRRLEEASAAVLEVVETLADDGPTTAEVEAVRKETADLAERVERDPKYWARVLSESDLRAVAPADLGGLAERYRSMTAEGLRETLARCATPERRLTVLCRPAGEVD
jgi:predicted Zn-dependent peptidase